MIDHHGIGEAYASNCYIRPEAAATGEILFDLVKLLASNGRIEVTEALCTNLYAAISGDTGCFRFSNATPKTHMRAAELLACGIDAADINHRLFECKSEEQLRAEAAGVSNLQVFGDGKIAVITFPYALKAALNLSDEHLETLIDVARSLEGVCVAICIRQPQSEGRFRASVRSSCNYDVSALCRKFDGGGHVRAAGCDRRIAIELNKMPPFRAMLLLHYRKGGFFDAEKITYRNAGAVLVAVDCGGAPDQR